MTFKAFVLAAAVLAQPLSLVPGLNAGAALAAQAGGGGGGGAAGSGSNGEGGNVMQNGMCLTWNYKAAEEAVRLQKEVCPKKVSEAGSLLRAQ